MRDHARAHGGNGSGSANHDHRHGTPGKSTLVERDDGASAHTKRQGGSGHSGGGGKSSVEVSVGKTKNAELAKLIPVGTDRNHAKKVTVLQLKPSDLPALKPGDDLTTPCEL